MSKASNIPILLIFLIFLNLLIFIKSIDIDYDDESQRTRNETNPEEINPYTIRFPSNIPKYIKVTVTPHQGLTTPILCYSPTDSNCIKNRIVYDDRADKKPAIAFVKNEEIKNSQFYILVTCKDINKCGYKIKLEENTKCKLEEGTIYSYIITEENKNMEFDFYGQAPYYTILNIGIEGNTKAYLTTDPNYEYSNYYLSFYSKAKFISVPILNSTLLPDLLFSFSISEGNVGDFIRLSAYTYLDGNAPDNLLYPGGPTISGVLYKHGLGYPEICFPVSSTIEEFEDTSRFYLTGVMHSKYGLFWLRNSDFDYMEETEIEISNGLIAIEVEPNGKQISICFEYYGSYYEQQVQQSDVAFSISLVPAPFKKTGDFYYIPPPQITDMTYSYILPKGKTLLYSSIKVEDNSRYDVFLYNTKGIARMHIADCDNAPYCKYNMSESSEDIKKMELVDNSGKFLLYDSIINKGWDSFDKNKKVMVITCLDDGNDEKGYCQFDLSIYNKNETVTLIENQNYAKYVEKGHKGVFQIYYKGGINLLSAFVEIMVHSGEVTFKGDFSPYFTDSSTESSEQYASATTYILANKIFIYFDLKRFNYESFFVKYTAIKNSFFTIKYHHFRADEKNEYLEEIIFPGESYLLNINPETNERYTIAHVENNRYKTKSYFMTNFYALNCDFKILTNKTQGETEISFADGYAQDIMGEEEGKIYSSDYYDYKISIEKEEKSNYDKKMCMIYVAGYNTKDSYSPTSILIANNVNQQIIFDESKFKSVRFLFKHTDLSKSLIVYANIIDLAFYNIQISINKETNILKKEVITRSYPYYLNKTDIEKYCQNKNTYCNIIVIIELAGNTPGMSVTNPMVEITIREATPKGEAELLRVPTYMQKNMAQVDFTTGDGYYYLYTDIGKGDEGEITVNFFRDNGEVYGRIVQKDVRDKNEEKIEWLDLYRLPEEGPVDEDKFNGYLKKYQFSAEDTKDCAGGCYLILGIRISQIGEWAEDWKFYTFSIITLIGPKFYYSDDASKVTIQIDEFIIGNVDISSDTRISQFYEVWITRDANEIQIDWQSELAGLYINIDGKKPSTSDADFILLPNGKDNIFRIEKYSFITKAKEKKIKLPHDSSLEDLNLIIGVWTDKTDSADTELYSLRIRETGFTTGMSDNEVDIIEVNTDQRIMCRPTEFEGSFRCLFMITYNSQDVGQKMDLLVYSASTNLGAEFEMYASFIPAKLFNEYNITELEKKIPNSGNAEFDSTKDDLNYLYIKLNENRQDQYLYVNIKVDTLDDVMMIASINSYEILNNVQYYYANPRTEQIVQVKKDKMNIIFPVEANFVLTVVDLGGEANLNWYEDSETLHYLRGKGDRVTLTTSSNHRVLNITKTKSDKSNNEGLDPGFVFIMKYYTRNSKINFDEVEYGNSIEIGYRNTDLPVFLYSKISDFTSDINLAVTFADNHKDEEGEYTSSPISVKATLDTRNKIYSSKMNPGFVPSNKHTITGYYDPAIKTAQVFLQDVEMQTFNISPEDFPTLLLYIKKEKPYKDKKYETFNLETQFRRTNSLVVPNEKIYNYGKFNGLVTQFYRFKTDKNKKIMKIVLSFNGDELSWAIGNQNSHDNDTSLNMTCKEENGKIIITAYTENKNYIYLNIFKTDYFTDPQPHLQNYAFKYINIEDESQYFDYKIKNDDGTLEYKEETEGEKIKITCTFNKIDLNKDDANITYFLKIIDSKMNQGEKIKTVALSESPYYTKYKRNPDDNNDKITLTATGDFSDWVYLQIIAQVQQNKVIDYVAYDGVKKKLKSHNYYSHNGMTYISSNQKLSDSNNKNKNNNNVLIQSIFFILIVGAIFITMLLISKNMKSSGNNAKINMEKLVTI